jgi:putative oxidoreductase
MQSEAIRSSAALIGRVLLAALFILEGWSKIRGYGPAVTYMERYGVPGVLLPAAIAIELGGGILIAIGWQTRLAALALAGFCVAAALLFHNNLADRNQVLHFEKDLAIAGGLLVLFAFGAGRYSLDRS